MLVRSFPHLTSIILVLVCAALAGCATSVNDYLVEAQKGDPESIQNAVVNVGRLLRNKEEQGISFDAGDEAAVKYLAEVAELGKDAISRASAVASLSHLQRVSFTRLYLGRLEDKSWSVQLEAAKALGKRIDAVAVPTLVERLNGSLRTEVRLEILRSLGRTGGEAALKALLKAFLDSGGPYADMRLTIYDGLRELGHTQLAFDDITGWRQLARARFPELEPAPRGLQSLRSDKPTEQQKPGE